MENTAPQENTAVKPEEEIKNKEILLDGYIFLKYGSWGDPGYRHVFLSPDLKTICWKHVDEEKVSGSIPLISFNEIKIGRHTPIFKRKPAKSPEQDKLSFSLLGTKRSLDLESSSKEQMQLFLEGLESVILWIHKQKK